MRGAIRENHMPVNKYQLLVVGLPVPLTPVAISGLEEELQTVDLPDRTKASGGNTSPTEFDITLPMHHSLEISAMETWFRQSQDPVLPTYKKAATLIHKRLGPGPARTYQLVGVFPKKRVLPDLEMENEGEMATEVWTLSVDAILPT